MSLFTMGLMVSAAAGPRGVESGVAAPAGLERAYASRRVALVVGIDAYLDPALGDLKYAAKDAADVAAVLRDPRLGAYDTVSVVSGEVGRQAFWDAFTALASTIERDDTVLVYVAGHGTLDLGSGGTELYLLGSDAWLARAPQTGIRVEELAQAVEALPARRTVMVLDACYSGTGRSVVSPDVQRKLERLRGPPPSPPALAVSEFAAHLYAAHIHQPSIEDPHLANGVYTHFFVDALRGQGDTDGDGLVEVMEAHGYARDRTLEYTGGSQVPWAETVSVGREALYLAGDPSRRVAAETALLRGLEGLPDGAVVTVDGLSRGAGPLPEGRRQIEVTLGERVLLSAQARVRPGDELDLTAELARRQPALLISGGAQLGPDQQTLGPGALSASASLALAEGCRGRPELGLVGSAGPGPVRPPGEGFAAGTLAARAGWMWTAGPLQLGPSVGAGLAWRLPAEPGPQAAPLLLPGATLRAGRAIYVELTASAAVFRADLHTVALPSAGLAVGSRLRSW
jgi:hypothetical protein